MWLYLEMGPLGGATQRSWEWSSQDWDCCCSVTRSCPTLYNPMDCSTPGFPILHSLSEFAQTHVHWVNEAIKPSHSMSPSSPPVLSLSQNQGLFQWVSPLHQVAKVLELQLQHPWMNIQGWFPLGWTGLISLLSKGLSRVFSNTTIQKHQFFNAQPFLWFNLDRVLKSRDITLPTKVCIVRATVFSVVVYRFKSWIVTNGNSAVIRRGWRAGSLSFWGDNEKLASHTTTALSPKPNHTGTLTSDFQPTDHKK